MKFKQKLALLKRSTVSKDIAGQTFTFYPISIPMLFELKSTMQPLMAALKSLFSKSSNAEGTQTVEETRDPLTQQVIGKVTHLGTPDVALVRLRAEQEDKALAVAIEAVFGEQNRMLLGRVLADSLRDLEIRTDAEIAEFIKDPSFDLPLLVEFLGGFFSVNAQVFGPFAERVRTLVREKMSDLTQSSNPQADASASAGSPEQGANLGSPTP